VAAAGNSAAAAGSIKRGEKGDGGMA